MKLVRVVSVILFVQLFSHPVFSQSLAVTKVWVKGNQATVIINDFLKVREIKFKKRSGKITSLNFPTYISKSGRKYPQVKVKSEKLLQRIKKAILTKKPVGKRTPDIKFKITKLSPYTPKGKKSSLKAFCSVLFNNEIEVECKVMKSRYQDEYWIAWPARPPEGGGKWIDQVEIVKPSIKRKVEKTILSKYKKGEFTEGGFYTGPQVNIEIVPGGKPVPTVVTSVKVKKSKAEVVLNNTVLIRDIKIKKIGNKTILKFPEYVAKSGRVYPQIKFLDPSVKKAIRKAVLTKKPASKPVNKISYRIGKFSKFRREGSKLKYFCSVIFNDKFEVECKIMEGRSGPWVSWPARPPKGGGSWIKQIYIINKKVRKRIEAELLKRYEEEESGSYEEEY